MPHGFCKAQAHLWPRPLPGSPAPLSLSLLLTCAPTQMLSPCPTRGPPGSLRVSTPSTAALPQAGLAYEGGMKDILGEHSIPVPSSQERARSKVGQKAGGLWSQEEDGPSGERQIPGRPLGATVSARDSDDHGLGPGHPK